MKGAAPRRALLCLVPLFALMALSLPALAAINQSFNYQGFLLSKATNLPVEIPQDIKFIIYNAASGGSALFTESRCNVGVSKGRYDVEIGSMTTGGVPDSLFLTNQNLWLEIQVDADGSCSGPYEAMSPRIRLQASPFAFNSLYASTASAATTVFRADILEALPQTTYGAITISTNLFVQGGISVGSISPGQKLAVAGVVESTGNWPSCGADPFNYTCGFRFPDGSVQLKAAAITMWEGSGNNVYSINPGNVGIGESLTMPLARLHVSTAAGDTGDIFLVTAGAVEKFKINGLGEIYGNGAKLSGLVRQAGDTMTGHLRLEGSSLTATSPFGVEAPKLKLAGNVELSSASAAQRGGIYISSNVYLPAGAVYYGDGGGLTNLFTYDNTKVWRTGDTMAGPLTLGFSTTTLTGSTLTVTGSAFSVTGSTFAIAGGSVAVGSLTSFPAKLSVVGGIIATSSITAQQGLYSSTLVNAPYGNFTQSVTASTATFWGFVGPDPDNSYSVTTASGIKVNAGKVVAPFFVGSGALLDGVLKSTDTSKVSKAGDTMTGNLVVLGSSLTVNSYGEHQYAVTVGTLVNVNDYYGLVVTTAGNVGVQVNSPAAPLEVRKTARISYTSDTDTDVSLDLSSYYSGYISWKNAIIAGDGDGPQQGALGFLPISRTLVYRALGEDPSTNNFASRGAEVFRIASDRYANWKFGIGTEDPQERFHVGANVLVSTRTTGFSDTVPVFFASTTTSRVSISTTTQTHSLTVGQGIVAGSSITAQGGFVGADLQVSSISYIPDSGYDAIYVNSRVAVGGMAFLPTSDVHVRGTLRVDQPDGTFNDVVLSMFPETGGNSYIRWQAGGIAAPGALGVRTSERDLIYVGGDASIASASLLPPLGTGNGTQAFRIKPDGKFLIGDALSSFIATERFQVMTNLMVSNADAGASIIYVSTGLASVGFSTGTPKERVHVASSFLVGGDRASAALFVSTATGFTGVGTGNPAVLLDVNGAMRVQGTLDAKAAILGSGSHTGAQALPATGNGTRFMWVPTMSAIRAGNVTGTQWDGVGAYSAAFGQNNIASGTYSAALGGYSHTVHANSGVVAGGAENYVSGEKSSIPGGMYNIVMSSYAFAGGRKTYVSDLAEGTFAWGFSDTAGNGFFNNTPVTQPYSFIIDPSDVKHYTVGIRTPAPQAALDVNGDAQFGAGVTKSTFTAEGYWLPRSMTQAQFLAAPNPAEGAMAYSITLHKLCFFNGTTWVTVKEETTCE
ncbi:MAG: hypothetical protein A2X31_13695 [Elusimicrobia bacterium GWB2_63_22]|nr:MAG: hypothetical protein A2X31_13695 [Elusimicrobia bacterium GWB2_63_22]